MAPSGTASGAPKNVSAQEHVDWGLGDAGPVLHGQERGRQDDRRERGLFADGGAWQEDARGEHGLGLAAKNLVVPTGFPELSHDTKALKQYGQPSGARILDPENVAASVVHTFRQPDRVAVNEIMVEPRNEPI